MTTQEITNLKDKEYTEEEIDFLDYRLNEEGKNFVLTHSRQALYNYFFFADMNRIAIEAFMTVFKKKQPLNSGDTNK